MKNKKQPALPELYAFVKKVNYCKTERDKQAIYEFVSISLVNQGFEKFDGEDNWLHCQRFTEQMNKKKKAAVKRERTKRINARLKSDARKGITHTRFQAETAVEGVKPHYSRDGTDVSTTEFLSTFEWKQLRMLALKTYGNVCQCCGASPSTGAVLNVDHIKPRKLHPELALDITNLQILCSDCNHGKGNWDDTDWR